MAEARRQALIARIARLRELEHRQAAASAALAQGEAEAARRLAQRAGTLAATYGDPGGAETGHELAARRLSGERMRAIAGETGRKADAARERAELRLAGERQARRRLERTQEAAARLAAEQAEQAQRQEMARFLNSGKANQRGS